MSKAIIFLAYHKQKKNIPYQSVDKLLSSHRFRIRKILEFVNKGILDCTNLNKHFLEKFNQNQADILQEQKMKMMYVDWIDNDWHNPLKFNSTRLEQSYRYLQIQYSLAYDFLFNDVDYQKLI